MLGHLTAQPAAGGGGGPLRSPITTHVLDTALGAPGRGLRLQLLKADPHSGAWVHIGAGVTNADGRVGDLMAPSDYMPPGHYKMHFETGAYYSAIRSAHPAGAFLPETPFYPQVDVEFVITPDKAHEHYHIPLLLSPYTFSTYKGS